MKKVISLILLFVLAFCLVLWISNINVYAEDTPKLITVYFLHQQKWKPVCLYYQTPTTETSWPGIEMTHIGPNENDVHIYSAQIPEDTTLIIFSKNGNNQTGDITNIGDGYYYDASGNRVTSSGEFNELDSTYKSDDYTFWEPKSRGTYKELNKIGGKITGFIQVLGSVLSIAALVIFGIKYMFGSAAEKADYKKTMIPYIVGCIMVFACSALPKVIYNIASKF